MPAEIDDLETIVTIVESGSFRAAAEKLNKAPSAVSYSVKRLEDNLRISIFDRDEYRPKLTEAGKEVYNKAIKILQINSDLIEFGSQMAAGIEHNIKLVVDSMTPQEMFLRPIKKFQKKFPATNLNLDFQVTDNTQKSLTEGDADIVISYKPSNNVECDSKIFCKIEFLPVSAASHPSQKRGANLESIGEMTQVIIKDRSSIDIDLSFPSMNKLKQWQVLDLTSKKNIILESLAWGYLPKAFANEELQKGKLKVIEALPKRTYCLHLIRKKQSSYGPAIDFLWQELLSYTLEEHIGFKMM